MLLLRADAAAHISTEAERGTGYCFSFSASDTTTAVSFASILLLLLSFTLRCFGRLLLLLFLAASISVLYTAILRLWLLTALLLRRDGCWKNT